MSDVTGCIPSNPDITGIGVRTAIYAQNLFGFGPALYALYDKKVTPTELEALETQSTGILLTAFALLLSTIVQAKTLPSGLPDYYVTIILQLSWINNTNTFIYFILYFYRRSNIFREKREADRGEGEELRDVSQRPMMFMTGTMKRAEWKGEFFKALRNPVLALGALHLTLMGCVGIWFWGGFAPFGASTSCPHPPDIIVIAGKVSITSDRLKGWSLAMYGLLLTPVLNMVLPMILFVAPFMIYHRWSGSRAIGTDVTPAVSGLAMLLFINLVLIIDVEVGLRINAGLIQPGNGSWTFGQTLALLLLLVAIRDLAEILFERQPRRLGQKLLDAAAEGEWDVMKYVLDLGANIDFRGEQSIEAQAPIYSTLCSHRLGGPYCPHSCRP